MSRSAANTAHAAGTKAVEDAVRQSDESSRRARVVVKPLHDPQQATDAAALLERVWNGGGPGAAPVEPGLLIALEHAGNYTVGAYRGDELLGVAVGFFGEPAAALMHSHIAGVSSEAAGQGVGAALKLHQRAWCLQRGVAVLEWTFDPLILRNASFNVNRLGAQLAEYLPQFYGEMRDATNAGQGSDRALIRWHLMDPVPAARADSGENVPLLLDMGDGGAPLRRVAEDDLLRTAESLGEVVGLRVPKDIPAMRRERPDLSAQWRTALRGTMGLLMGAGWDVIGVRREGVYLLRRPQTTAPRAAGAAAGP